MARPNSMRRLFVPSGVLVAMLLVASTFANAAPEAGSAAPSSSGERGSFQAVAQPLVIPDVFDGDIRDLPGVASHPHHQLNLRPPVGAKGPVPTSRARLEEAEPPASAMPSTTQNFDGLAFSDSCTGGSCGSGFPPDTVGDVGPNHYVQAVNTSFGIFSKTGTRLAGLTFDALWVGAGAGAGTACDGNNQGDPTVVYDSLADRWIVADFAFGFSGPNPVGPFFECIAVSQTADPVAGGWFLYAVRTDPGTPGAPPAGLLADYPKMGLWPDAIYMTANEFDTAGSYRGVGLWAFNRAQMEAGLPLQQVTVFVPFPATQFGGALPANLRGNPPPAGTPEFIVSESITDFEFEVRRFSVNFGTVPPSGTLSAPTLIPQTAYDFSGGDIVPQPGTSNKLDSLIDRLMMQAQYRNFSGTESVWVSHTVQPSSGAPTGVQWAQLNVTGGAVSSSAVQQGIFTGGGDGLFRWMPSLAVDASGNMAVGYSVSSSSVFPSIRYAGRLASDPLGALSQGEATMIAGGGSQTNDCGGAPCHRWGDYSAMSVDPTDDCTFWYTNQYYPSGTDGSAGNWHTRIASFKFPTCGAAPPPPPPAEHSRSVSFFDAGRRAKGVVSVDDGFAECASGVPIKLQEKHGGWRTVDTGTTNATGGFSARLASGSLYRVVAPRRTLASGDVCLKATSPKLRWL